MGGQAHKSSQEKKIVTHGMFQVGWNLNINILKLENISKKPNPLKAQRGFQGPRSKFSEQGLASISAYDAGSDAGPRGL